MFIEDIARVCHEANRAYCQTLGDESQPSWNNAPDWQIQSSKDAVRFHLDNPDATESATHEKWLADREEAGWKYGPVKDVEKKENPCFVPFNELPLEQQRKDKLFKFIVDALR